jgi:hypothetical protein
MRLVQPVFVISLEHIGNPASHPADDLDPQIFGIVQKIWAQSPAHQGAHTFLLKDPQPLIGIRDVIQRHFLA